MWCEENVSESIGSSGRLKRLQGAEVSFTCFMFDTHLFIKDEKRLRFMLGDLGFGER